MKNFLKISLLAFALIFFVSPSSALVAPSSHPEPLKKEAASSPLSHMSVEDFLALTPKKFKELTGQKMSIAQKLSLKMTQHKLKKELKANHEVSVLSAPEFVDSSDFNIGGFLLGLLLSIIGVLIAYLIGDSSVVKWAWIGFGVWMVIFLLVLIL